MPSAEGFAATPPALDGPTLRLVETTPTGAVYELRAEWRGALAESVRRFAADPAALVLDAVRGYATMSESVVLPAVAEPSVEVIAADFEEAPLSARRPVEDWTEADQTAFEALTRPPAEVVAVGVERRRPTGTLVVRLLHVDEARGTVRRYRRVLVRVGYTAGRMGPDGAPVGALVRGGDNPHLGVTRSVLATGTWFKIPITRAGVYRIDRAYLEALGVAGASSLDFGRVQVFHNGGDMLPELNSAPRPADLVENAALVAGDALYFFADGPSDWVWNADDGHWEHRLNYFTNESYVFLRVDGANAARVGGASFPAFPDAERQATAEGRVFAEDDLVNLVRNGGGSGLEWLGAEVATGRPRVTVLDTVPPGLAGGAVRYRARAAARANPAVTLSFRVDGVEQAAVSPQPVSFGGSGDGPLAHTRIAAFEGPPASGGRLAVDMVMEGSTNNPIAWIDWIEAVFPQALRAHEGVLRFPTPGGRSGRFEFALEGFTAEPQVWDVTDPAAIRRLGVRAEGGRYLVQVEVAEGAAPRELVAFEPGAAGVAAPAAGVAVPNQDLHGLAGYPDYVIIAPAEFRQAAEELAAHRRTRDGLATVVVDIGQVYNEFSGGQVDMRAVRDYLRFLYDRAPDDALPRYALFMGDGHYDFRGRLPGGEANNWIPTFQTFESLNLIVSYTSDDYFGLLDPDEGVWAYPGHPTPGPERVDLGIGRFPVRSAEEAAHVVAKILHYEDPATHGAWRSRFTFVADDQYPSAGDLDLHVQNAEVVAEAVRDDFPDVNLQKIYSTSYPSVVTAVGRRVPEATADIRRALDEGTLVWNYSGHGGHDALADERLITLEDIEALDNYDRLSIFVTATCSFGRFDMVDKQSGAEMLLLNPHGGAVALFTTVRLVYTSTSPDRYNLGLNLRLTDYLLGRDDDGRPRRLGDVMRLTKTSDVGAQGNNRKFAFLGDPAMRVGLPHRPVQITSVNGIDLAGTPLAGTPLAGTTGPGGPGMPELRANEFADITGQVLGFDGQPDLTFDGEVELEVFDAARVIRLDPAIALYTDGEYRVRTDRLYRGRATVRGGAFSARFIVPRDVSYSGLPGRISAYVSGPSGLDGVGTSEAFVIGETAGPPLDDTQGPQIRAFLNDTTFVDGGLVNREPTLVVRLFDESGINTVGTGVGHELLVTFDGDPASAQEIGRFYEGDLDSYQAGTVRFALPEQEPGPHRLRVTAWDVANNSSSVELAYVVTGDEGLALRNVYNYPNPTTGRTRFLFEHNQPAGTMARVQLRLYTLAGRPVRTLEWEDALSGNLVQIPFDGLDEDFDPLATGIYLYHVRVSVDRPDGGTDVAERIERLAVIR